MSSVSLESSGSSCSKMTDTSFNHSTSTSRWSSSVAFRALCTGSELVRSILISLLLSTSLRLTLRLSSIMASLLIHSILLSPHSTLSLPKVDNMRISIRVRTFHSQAILRHLWPFLPVSRNQRAHRLDFLMVCLCRVPIYGFNC